MLWLNVAVIPRFSWPNKAIALTFEGRSIVLSPPTDKLACRASLYDPNGTTFEDGGTILARFLSRLAWSHNGGVIELFYSGSNNPTSPGRLGHGAYGKSSWATVNPPHYIYLPAAASTEADLGLALYREGMSINSAPFAFLSYVKVLNILYENGGAQKMWINNNLRRIWYQPAADRLDQIRSAHADVGRYMYKQGRCAVAHAYGKAPVNPDVYVDKRRLEEDLPLMKELAALFIEKELRVPSTPSFQKNVEGSRNLAELLMMGGAAGDRIAYVPYRSNA